MWSIQEIRDRIKFTLDGTLSEWGITALVFLLAIASFGLGRLSATLSPRQPLSIVQARVLEQRAMNIGGLYVASRSGNAYFFPWCAGAANIAAANRVWFTSEASARNAGYAPAKNCKGL